jgi:hypothetical protein
MLNLLRNRFTYAVLNVPHQTTAGVNKHPNIQCWG